MRPNRKKENQIGLTIRIFLKFFSIEVIAGLLVLIITQFWILFFIGESATIDWRFKFRSVFQNKFNFSKDIVLVALDEKTMRHLENKYGIKERTVFPRFFLNQLLTRLKEFNPKVIGLDILINHYKDSSDNNLINTILQNNRIVLVTELIKNRVGGFDGLDLIEEFEENDSVIIGHSYFWYEKEKIRWLKLVAALNDKTILPSFALAMYYKGIGFDKRSQIRDFIVERIENDRALTIEGNRFPGHLKIPINFLDIPSSLLDETHYLSAIDLLELPHFLLEKILNDKYILIGATYDGASDMFLTPIGGIDKIPDKLFGLELHMFALNSLLMNEWIKPVSLFQKMVYVIFSMIIVFVIWKYNPILRSIFLTIAFLIAWWIASFLFFIFYKGMMIPLVHPSIFMIVLTITFLFYKFLKEELETSLFEEAWRPHIDQKHLDDTISFFVGKEFSIDKLTCNKEIITILYAHIYGLQEVMDNTEIHNTIKFVNELIGIFKTKSIFLTSHKGSYDKFIGLSFFSYFGVPYSDEDKTEALCAINTAHDLKILLSDYLNSIDFIPSDIKNKLNVGIGIHTGDVIIATSPTSNQKYEPLVLGESLEYCKKVEMINQLLISSDIFLSKTSYNYLEADIEAQLMRQTGNPLLPEFVYRLNKIKKGI